VNYLCKKNVDELFWNMEHVVQVDQGCFKSFKGSERGTLEQEILGTSQTFIGLIVMFICIVYLYSNTVLLGLCGDK